MFRLECAHQPSGPVSHCKSCMGLDCQGHAAPCCTAACPDAGSGVLEGCIAAAACHLLRCAVIYFMP
eukprot:3173983-Lingulodinium_polyedra.AAC.1